MFIDMIKETKKWQVSTDETGKMIITWGVNKLQTREYQVKGKNKGKANETNPEQQAKLEAMSRAKKKLDEGYHLTDESDSLCGLAREVEEFEVILPMLAKKFDEKIIGGDFHIQPKLDGMRCICTYRNGIVTLRSRKGKPVSLPHLEQAIKTSCDNSRIFDVVLDGEIYNHDMNFQQIISAIKKPNSDTIELEYHVYDVVDKYKPFVERFIESGLKYNDFVKQVDTSIYCHNITQIKDKYEHYLKNGYEGAIIRVGSCLYRVDKRSSQLLKYKPFDDAEFEITGHEVESMSNGKDGVIFVCKTEQGVEFKARPKGTEKERHNMLKSVNELMGKLLTVRFQGKTNDNIPRFPVGISIRDYE